MVRTVTEAYITGWLKPFKSFLLLEAEENHKKWYFVLYGTLTVTNNKTSVTWWKFG